MLSIVKIQMRVNYIGSLSVVNADVTQIAKIHPRLKSRISDQRLIY